MTDLEALYQAILADPDDDTLRLVYADALEEAGDARRAGFVRAHVQLARVPEYDPAWVRARYHDRARMSFAARWMLELPPLPDGLDWAREAFRRGLPAAVQADTAAAFVAHADELFAKYPVEAVELSVAPLREARAFADSPWVSHLVRLSVASGLSGHAANRLFNSPHYDRLRELHVGAGLTTDTTAGNIVRSRAFKGLTRLSCRDDRGGGRALVVHLLRLADPPKLQALDLSGVRLDAEHVTRLLAAPALSAVEELTLGDNSLRAEGVRAVAGADLPHLRSLSLLRTHPGVNGVWAVAEAGFLPGLRSLSLGGNNLPAVAAGVLAGSAGVAGLRVLDLRENRLGDDGAAALAASPHLSGLVDLDLAENLVEDAGADALTGSPHLGGLIHLNLHGNVIAPPAAARLRRRFGDRVFL
ncbi:MAG: hypothetical protein C0501_07185 [Isosphaera sp.]|nr:hypothetical protein [Isosphaera sp.]